MPGPLLGAPSNRRFSCDCDDGRTSHSGNDDIAAERCTAAMTTRVTVTDAALRDMVREALDNKEFSGWSSNEEGHAKVSPTVDPSIAVTDPVNPNFTPQDKTELGVAIGQLVKNLPDTDMPGIYAAVKQSIEQKSEKEQEADMKKQASQGGTEQVEEALRLEIRSVIANVLSETFVDPADAQADADDDDPTDTEGRPKRPHSYKATALGGGMSASFEEIAKEHGMSVAGAKQAVDKAIEKLKFLYGLPEDDRELIVLTAMNAYVEKLSKTGELTASDVQLMKDHPDIVRELDGFREFLHNSIRKVRKPGQELEDPLGEGVVSEGSTAAKVAERKRKRPDLYCSKCLWMTGGGDCPRHGGEPWTKEREAAAKAKSRGGGEMDEADEVKAGDTLKMRSLNKPTTKPNKTTTTSKSLTNSGNTQVDWNGMDEGDGFEDLKV